VNANDLLVRSERWRLATFGGRVRWLGDDERRRSESSQRDLPRVWALDHVKLI